MFSVVSLGLGPVGFALCGPTAHLVGTQSFRRSAPARW